MFNLGRKLVRFFILLSYYVLWPNIRDHFWNYRLRPCDRRCHKENDSGEACLALASFHDYSTLRKIYLNLMLFCLETAIEEGICTRTNNNKNQGHR